MRCSADLYHRNSIHRVETMTEHTDVFMDGNERASDPVFSSVLFVCWHKAIDTKHWKLEPAGWDRVHLMTKSPSYSIGWCAWSRSVVVDEHSDGSIVDCDCRWLVHSSSPRIKERSMDRWMKERQRRRRPRQERNRMVFDRYRRCKVPNNSTAHRREP